MRIFCEVDDVLVLWGTFNGSDYPLKLNAQPKGNQGLIDALRELYLAGAAVYLWAESEPYARIWADLYLPESYTGVRTISFEGLLEGDIVVDGYGHWPDGVVSLRPEQLVEETTSLLRDLDGGRRV